MYSSELPRMIEVKQIIHSPKLNDYKEVIRQELKAKSLEKKIKPGMKIAITAGSRGIAHYQEILAIVVEEVKRLEGIPFLVPSMGSHGGATPQGQIEVLESLGINPETVGAPISSSMEVDEIGRLDNDIPVFFDRKALESDGIIVIGRVKPHTDFKDVIESGLMKMISIGLGKQKGAEIIHWYRSEGYHKLMPAAARLIMKNVHIIIGIAIVENARHEISIVKALEPNEIEEEERELLETSKDLLARIPFKEIDVLIVDEIGKNISGVGMDTNVIGRFWMPGEKDPRTPQIKRIVVLDLTDETHGNAIGIGLADITTKKLISKIDFDSTYVNCLTAGSLETGRVPPFLPNDRDAISTALRTVGPINPKMTKVIRIKNTLELENFWISESLKEVVETNPTLSERVKFVSKPREMQFDVIGTLAK